MRGRRDSHSSFFVIDLFIRIFVTWVRLTGLPTKGAKHTLDHALGARRSTSSQSTRYREHKLNVLVARLAVNGTRDIIDRSIDRNGRVCGRAALGSPANVFPITAIENYVFTFFQRSLVVVSQVMKRMSIFGKNERVRKPVAVLRGDY
jgi:hypothetical protein